MGDQAVFRDYADRDLGRLCFGKVTALWHNNGLSGLVRLSSWSVNGGWLGRVCTTLHLHAPYILTAPEHLLFWLSAFPLLFFAHNVLVCLRCLSLLALVRMCSIHGAVWLLDLPARTRLIRDIMDQPCLRDGLYHKSCSQRHPYDSVVLLEYGTLTGCQHCYSRLVLFRRDSRLRLNS